MSRSILGLGRAPTILALLAAAWLVEGATANDVYRIVCAVGAAVLIYGPRPARAEVPRV